MAGAVREHPQMQLAQVAVNSRSREDLVNPTGGAILDGVYFARMLEHRRDRAEATMARAKLTVLGAAPANLARV